MSPEGQFGLSPAIVHTNTVEGHFSVLRRGMKVVYQPCGHQHPRRCATELEFRHNPHIANGVEDTERAGLILKGAEGKRLSDRRRDVRASA